ncbi:hypothetical protein MUK42_09331 [Musa troglodytarum]|uniref:G protein gamma domain-containing protein n=1 Tax=Musa troglodytarum TaxID=320322 RepID=A0A9E7EA32_9LILI|nr:hypothetical protein MUK42_09331 [Musa troglodytarum]
MAAAEALEEKQADAPQAPRPRSPPRYTDLCGRHRLQARVQLLSREIGFLEEELQSVEGLQPVSVCCKEYVIFSFSLLNKVDKYVGTTPDPLIPSDISPAASGDGSGQWFASMRHASLVVARAGRTDLVALVDPTGPSPLAVDALAEAAAVFPAPDYTVSSQVSHVLDILVDVSVLVPTIQRYAFALHVCVVLAAVYPLPVRGPTRVRGLPGFDRTARGESRFRRRSCLTAAISCSAGSTAAASAERKLRRKLA